jgi:acetoin utilization protein AcuB
VEVTVDVANLPVRRVMTTRVLVAASDDELALAWEVMRHAGVRHLPVVEGSRLVGMVDDRRLIREWLVSPLATTPRTVAELVDAPPVQVRPDDTVRSTARMMVAGHLDAVCVTDDTGRLVGVLTTADLVRALAGLPRADDTDPGTVPLLFRLTPVV